ncbi:MAG: phage/plasmid primase, P4 family [Acidimicrobiia bacterium]
MACLGRDRLADRPRRGSCQRPRQTVSRWLYQQLANFPANTSNDNHDVARKALNSWAKQSASVYKVQAMINLARSEPGVLTVPSDLDADPDLLCVENGYVDLRTGTFHDPDPMKLMTKQAPVAYDHTANAPLWETSLADWQTDPDTREYLHRLCGEALSGTVMDHLFVIHFGHGRNGKGTFVGALRSVLGPYFVTPDKSLIVSGLKEHATVYVSLFRTRLAVAVETDRRVKLSEAEVKNLTGGDQIGARRLYEDQWWFDPTHSLWLATNYLPQITGFDEGIWERVKVVPWEQSYTGKSRVRDLGEQLRGEAPGILNWLIEGNLKWRADGIDTTPQKVTDATAEYRQKEDLFAQWLEDEGWKFLKGTRSTSKALGESYKGWADDNNAPPLDWGTLGPWLTAHGSTSYRSKGGRGWNGIVRENR